MRLPLYSTRPGLAVQWARDTLPYKLVALKLATCNFHDTRRNHFSDISEYGVGRAGKTAC